MTAFLIVLAVIVLIISVIGEALGIGFWAALGVLIGMIVLGALLTFIINKLAVRYPRIGEICSKIGPKFSAVIAGIGALLAIIGFFTDAGEEVHTYHQVYKTPSGYWAGRDVSYMASAVSDLLFFGLFILLIGIILLLGSFFIEKPNEETILQLKRKRNNQEGMQSLNELHRYALITDKQYKVNMAKIEDRRD